jgi:hypothetical protein
MNRIELEKLVRFREADGAAHNTSDALKGLQALPDKQNFLRLSPRKIKDAALAHAQKFGA